MWISELFPNVAQHADDLCMINGMNTDNPAHPQATHHDAHRQRRDSCGRRWARGCSTAWAPKTRTSPASSPSTRPTASAGRRTTAAASCPPLTKGRASTAPTPRAWPTSPPPCPPASQRKQIDLIQSMNRDLLKRSGENPQIEGVIESFELGFRMQSTVPGGDGPQQGIARARSASTASAAAPTDTFGRQCLMARRFAEAGVRFIEVAHTGWDQHTQPARQAHRQRRRGRQAHRRPAGRSQAARPAEGHAGASSAASSAAPPAPRTATAATTTTAASPCGWPAAASKAASTYGATDDYGYKAVANPMHVHDLHATILRLLGLDHEKLTYRYAGRDFRLTDVYGNVVKEIMA